MSWFKFRNVPVIVNCITKSLIHEIALNLNRCLCSDCSDCSDFSDCSDCSYRHTISVIELSWTAKKGLKLNVFTKKLMGPRGPASIWPQNIYFRSVILPPEIPDLPHPAQSYQEQKAKSMGPQGASSNSCFDECSDSQYIPLSCCLLLTSFSFFKTQSAVLSIKFLLSDWPFDQIHACKYLEYFLIPDFISAICWRDYKLKS